MPEITSTAPDDQRRIYALFGGAGLMCHGGARDLRFVGTLEDCRDVFGRQRDALPPLAWAHIAEIGASSWRVVAEWRAGEDGLREIGGMTYE